MPHFTIETTYHLPVFRQRIYEAETFDAACALAVADAGWDDEKSDIETSGDMYVTGAWEGRDTAYSGTTLAIPSQFGEQVQRQAGHFEVRTAQGLRARAGGGGLGDGPFWRQRLSAAILAGQPDPACEGSAS